MGQSILKRVLTGIALATLLVIVVGLFLPATYHVQRTVVIAADTVRIHELVDDLDRWPDWTPWLKADPSLEVTVGTITRGTGATQSWTGDSGGGALTFTSSDPEQGVTFDLSFDEGNSHHDCAIRYESVAGGTRVTWELIGDNGSNLLERYFGLVMDAFIGPMFEDGLATLKVIAERQTEPAV